MKQSTHKTLLKQQKKKLIIDYFQNKNYSIVNQILDLIKHNNFFKKNCSAEKQDFLVDALNYLQYEKYNRGDIIFNQGDFGDRVYLILLGEVGIYIQDNQKRDQYDETLLLLKDNQFYWKGDHPLFNKVYQYNDGQFFGEVALDSNKPRTASVIAHSDELYCLSLSKRHYKKLYKSALEQFINIFPESMLYQVSRFLSYFTTVTYPQNTILWQQYQQPQYFCFIISGLVELYYENKLNYNHSSQFEVQIKHRVVGQYSQGELIGFTEISDKKISRRQCCKCIDQTKVFQINQYDYQSIKVMFKDIDQILLNIDHENQKRIQNREQQINAAIINYQQNISNNQQTQRVDEFFNQSNQDIQQQCEIIRSKKQIIPYQKLLDKIKQQQLSSQQQQNLMLNAVDNLIKQKCQNEQLNKRRNNLLNTQLNSYHKISNLKQFQLKVTRSIEKYINKQDNYSIIQVKGVNSPTAFTSREALKRARSGKFTRVLSGYELQKSLSTEESVHNIFFNTSRTLSKAQ